MNKIIIFLLLSIFFCTSTSAQSLFSHSAKTFYISYGRHLPTRYRVDSGANNLISRKYNVSIEGGFNVDIPLANKWSLRTGINAHFHFVDESGYGTSGGLPPVFPADPSGDHNYNNAIKYNGQTTEYSDISCFSIPVKAQYQLKKGAKWEWYADAGAVLAIYLPVDIDKFDAQTWELPSPNGGYGEYRQFVINGMYRKSIFATSTGISPQLEWELGLETQHPYKKRGALVLGLKMHIGTNKLEQSDFIIWPSLPQYRSRGHYTLNRSYVGICIGYRFGRNAPLK